MFQKVQKKTTLNGESSSSTQVCDVEDSWQKKFDSFCSAMRQHTVKPHYNEYWYKELPVTMM